MIQISKAKDLAKQGNKLITIYGDGGVGKTTFALTNPHCPKTLVIGVEDDGGLVAIDNIHEQIAQNIDAVSVNYTGQSPAGALYTTLEHVKNLGYQNIVLDPVTNLRKKQASWLAGETQQTTITQRQWGEVASAMDMIFDKILELKQSANIIIVCHEERLQISDSINGNESFIIQPSLGKGLVNKVTQYSDEVIRISNEKDGRTFDLGGHPNITTKTRKFGRLDNQDKVIVGNLTIDQFLY